MCLLLETLGLHYSGGGAGLAQDVREGRERPLCVVFTLLHQWVKDHPGCLPATRPQLQVSEEWSASMGVGQIPSFAFLRISMLKQLLVATVCEQRSVCPQLHICTIKIALLIQAQNLSAVLPANQQADTL